MDFATNHEGVDDMPKSLNYVELIKPMVKAMQEMSDKIDALTTRITNLENGNYFPNGPTTGQKHTVGLNEWEWNGYAWTYSDRNVGDQVVFTSLTQTQGMH